MMAAFDHSQNTRIRSRMQVWKREHDASKAALARALHIKPASLHAILEGGGVSYRTARRFAELLNIELDELVGPAAPPGEEPPPGELLPPAAREAIGTRQLRPSTLAAMKAAAHLALTAAGWRSFITGLEYAAETAEQLADARGSAAAALDAIERADAKPAAPPSSRRGQGRRSRKRR